MFWFLFWARTGPSQGLRECRSAVCDVGAVVAYAPYTARQVAVRKAHPSRQTDFIMMAPELRPVEHGSGPGDKAKFATRRRSSARPGCAIAARDRLACVAPSRCCRP